MGLADLLISPQRQYDRLESQLEREFDQGAIEGLDDELLLAYRLGREDGLRLAEFRRKMDGA